MQLDSGATKDYNRRVKLSGAEGNLQLKRQIPDRLTRPKEAQAMRLPREDRLSSWGSLFFSGFSVSLLLFVTMKGPHKNAKRTSFSLIPHPYREMPAEKHDPAGGSFREHRHRQSRQEQSS